MRATHPTPTSAVSTQATSLSLTGLPQLETIPFSKSELTCLSVCCFSACSDPEPETKNKAKTKRKRRGDASAKATGVARRAKKPRTSGAASSKTTKKKAVKPRAVVQDEPSSELPAESDHPCPICKRVQHEDGSTDSGIVCDKCEVGYHLRCAGFVELPSGDWFCPSCRE
eukprot:m.103867 g.103867  ORF g.103867 m.103867 type:complete len:170 (+) comp9081_c0_seq2:822-1331(+)